MAAAALATSSAAQAVDPSLPHLVREDGGRERPLRLGPRMVQNGPPQPDAPDTDTDREDT